MTDNMGTVKQEATLTVHAENEFPLVKADHAMGLELQIVELVEQQTRARVQHRDDDAEGFEAEIAILRGELAATADLTSSAM